MSQKYFLTCSKIFLDCYSYWWQQWYQWDVGHNEGVVIVTQEEEDGSLWLGEMADTGEQWTLWVACHCIMLHNSLHTLIVCCCSPRDSMLGSLQCHWSVSGPGSDHCRGYTGAWPLWATAGGDTAAQLCCPRLRSRGEHGCPGIAAGPPAHLWTISPHCTMGIWPTQFWA